jgi:hypothetical protein
LANKFQQILQRRFRKRRRFRRLIFQLPAPPGKGVFDCVIDYLPHIVHK